MEKEGNKQVTIRDIAKKTGLSAATVSNALSARPDVRIAEETKQTVIQACKELNYTKGAAKSRVKKAGPTIADIAKEAGVSSAMVSYVVNNRTDLKIAEETRKKILQICNLRQYHPSAIAKSLASGKRDSNVVGIAFRYDPHSCLHNAHTFELIHCLQNSCEQQDFSVLLLPPIGEKIDVRENIAGIFCIDLPEEQFFTLKESYFVPIVALDMTVEDPLFYKVYTDFFALAQEAENLFGTPDFIYVSTGYNNRPYTEKLQKAFGNRLFSLGTDENDLAEFLQTHPDTPVLFCDEQAARLYSHNLPNRIAVVSGKQKGDKNGEYEIICMPVSVKTDRAVAMLRSAIARNETEEHTFRLTPRKE